MAKPETRVDMDEDTDLALALQLQAQFDEEYSSSQMGETSENCLTEDEIMAIPDAPYTPQKVERGSTPTEEMSLVDPRWEMLDPSPNIHALFLEFNRTYFWGKLAAIEVKWSPRMTL